MASSIQQHQAQWTKFIQWLNLLIVLTSCQAAAQLEDETLAIFAPCRSQLMLVNSTQVSGKSGFVPIKLNI